MDEIYEIARNTGFYLLHHLGWMELTKLANHEN